MEPKGLEEGVLSLRADAGGKPMAFLMMPLSSRDPIENLAKTVHAALAEFDVVCVRADDKAYSEDLWENIRIYMHAADFGVAIYERVETDDYNPNVSIEVGYMMALDTRVCLLKERRLPRLPSDIAGKLYYEFDIFEPQTSIRRAIAKWASSVGLSSRSDRAAAPHDAQFIILPPGVGPKSLRRILKPLTESDWSRADELRVKSGLGGHSFSRHLGYLRAAQLIVEAELPGRPIKLTEVGKAYYAALVGGNVLRAERPLAD